MDFIKIEDFNPEKPEELYEQLRKRPGRASLSFEEDFEEIIALRKRPGRH